MTARTYSMPDDAVRITDPADKASRERLTTLLDGSEGVLALLKAEVIEHHIVTAETIKATQSMSVARAALRRHLNGTPEVPSITATAVLSPTELRDLTLPAFAAITDACATFESAAGSYRLAEKFDHQTLRVAAHAAVAADALRTLAEVARAACASVAGDIDRAEQAARDARDAAIERAALKASQAAAYGEAE